MPKSRSKSNVIPMLKCRICGLPVSPKVDVAFGVGSKPLFYAHKGACAETIADTTELVGRVARIVLDAKKPGFAESAVKGLDKLKRLAHVLFE